MNTETQELLREVPTVVELAIREINRNCDVLQLESGTVVPFVLPIPNNVRKCVRQLCKAGGGSSGTVKSLFTDRVRDSLNEKGYQLNVKYRWRNLDFTLA